MAGLLAVAGPAVPQDPVQPPVERPRWETKHAIRLNGGTVEYDAVVGNVVLSGDGGEPTGEIFHTAYFRTVVPDPGSRPIIFSYNGGPGSASF